jgi:hypothetical protein
LRWAESDYAPADGVKASLSFTNIFGNKEDS